MVKALAYSYVRMSTDLQLKGDSLRRQMHSADAYVLEHNLELVTDFALEDIGVSAFKGKNVQQGALGKFLSAVEMGKVPKGSYLLVESLDRLSREKAQQATFLFLQILSAGINIATLIDKRLYRAGHTDFTDLIYSIIVMSRSHDESETKSVRLSQAWSNKRTQASVKKLTSLAPAWLVLSRDREAFEPIPEKASLVQQIFRDAEQGKGSYQITRALNNAGIAVWGSGNGWHESYIAKILTNRSVLGEFHPHHFVSGKRVPTGEVVPDYYPRIIDEDQFDRVQLGRGVRRLRGAGRKGPKNVNLFSGVAKCAYCNGSMVVVDKGTGPKGGVYLRCDNARRAHNCEAGSWSLGHFEMAFLHFVKEIDLDVLLSSDDKTLRSELETQMVTAKAKHVNLLALRDRAFELLSSPSNATAYVNERISQLSMEIALTQKDLEDIQGELSRTYVFKEGDNRDVSAWISKSNESTQEGLDARTKISSWIKLNVRELLVFTDGLDFPVNSRAEDVGPAKLKLKQFSATFSNGVFRSIRLIGNDPTSHALSIYADDRGWISENAEGQKFEHVDAVLT